MSIRIKAVLAGLLLAVVSVPVAAEERAGVSVTLGLGAGLSPDYFGSTTSSIGPTGVFSVQKLVLPGGFGIGSDSALPTDPGFGPRGAFRFVSSREASDNPELQGLNDIDFAVELGAGIFHITEQSRAFAEVRRGFGGHDGWVAEAGLDAILRPSPQLVLTAGPRANWGDTEFVRTYFGVTANEATRSQFPSFSPDGGLVSLGVELNARYDFRNGWGLHGTMGLRQFQGDAARSPITQRGSRDQYKRPADRHAQLRVGLLIDRHGGAGGPVGFPPARSCTNVQRSQIPIAAPNMQRKVASHGKVYRGKACSSTWCRQLGFWNRTVLLSGTTSLMDILAVDLHRSSGPP